MNYQWNMWNFNVSLLFVIKLWETNYDGPRTEAKLNKITKNSVYHLALVRISNKIDLAQITI